VFNLTDTYPLQDDLLVFPSTASVMARAPCPLSPQAASFEAASALVHRPDAATVEADELAYATVS